MHLLLVLVLSLLPTLVMSAPPNQQSESGAAYSAHLSELTSVLDRNAFAYALAVVKGGRTVMTRIKKGSLTFDEKTPFYMCSTSKVVSALYVSFLLKRGLVQLQEPVALRGDVFRNGMTVHHILTHTTGHSNYFGDPQIERGVSRERLVAHLRKRRADHVPGAHHSYSNLAFSLVASHVESRIGKPFADLLSEFLVHAVGASGASVGKYPPATVPRFRVSARKRQQISQEPSLYVSAVPAAAGVFMNLDGFAQVLKLAMGAMPSVLTKEDLAPFYLPHAAANKPANWRVDWGYPRDEMDFSYGYGWRVATPKSFPDRRIVFHSGMLSGARAFIGFLPAHDLGLVVFIPQDTRWATGGPLAFLSSYARAAQASPSSDAAITVSGSRQNSSMKTGI